MPCMSYHFTGLLLQRTIQMSWAHLGGGLLKFGVACLTGFYYYCSSFDADEVQVGKQIGEGSFGIVYEGYIGRGTALF